MKTCFRRLVGVTCLVVALSGCGSKETKEALQRASALSDQKQYRDANDVLISALRDRESKIRDAAGTPADATAIDAVTKKVQADGEILKMERAQIPLYLHLERADLASAVYSDIWAGHPGDTVVYDYLKDPDPVVRTGAVRVLGLAGRPDAIEALTTATQDTDKDVRRSAVAALGQIKDPKTIDPLIAALKDSYWFVRSEAAEALGRQKDGRAVKPLLDTVSDSDATVESSAENALVLICAAGKASADDLAARLNDANPRVATISAVCLALMKDGRAQPVLVKLASSTDAQVRLHAVKALGETGDASVIPTLHQTLKDPEMNVRGWSIIGLGKLKDTSAIPDLTAIANNASETPDIRAAANAAIAHINGTPAAATGP